MSTPTRKIGVRTRQRYGLFPYPPKILLKIKFPGPRKFRSGEPILQQTVNYSISGLSPPPSLPPPEGALVSLVLSLSLKSIRIRSIISRSSAHGTKRNFIFRMESALASLSTRLLLALKDGIKLPNPSTCTVCPC